MPELHAFFVDRGPVVSSFPTPSLSAELQALQTRRHHLILIIHLGKLQTRPIWAKELHLTLPVSLWGLGAQRPHLELNPVP